VTTFHTPPAIAKALGIKPERVVSMIRSGEIQAVNLASRGSRRPRFRVSEESLQAFLAGRAVVPPTPSPTHRQRRYSGKEYF
jgi:hypothetical protein